MTSIFYLLISLITLGQSADINEIHFGKGGGFTGMVNSYVLTHDGKLYKSNAYTDERTLLKTIDIEELNQIYKDLNNLDLEDIQYKKPGNTYKFIKLKRSDSTHEIVWSGKFANNNLNLFYSSLYTLVNSN